MCMTSLRYDGAHHPFDDNGSPANRVYLPKSTEYGAKQFLRNWSKALIDRIPPVSMAAPRNKPALATPTQYRRPIGPKTNPSIPAKKVGHTRDRPRIPDTPCRLVQVVSCHNGRSHYFSSHLVTSSRDLICDGHHQDGLRPRILSSLSLASKSFSSISIAFTDVICLLQTQFGMLGWFIASTAMAGENLKAAAVSQILQARRDRSSLPKSAKVHSFVSVSIEFRVKNPLFLHLQVAEGQLFPRLDYLVCQRATTFSTCQTCVVALGRVNFIFSPQTSQKTFLTGLGTCITNNVANNAGLDSTSQTRYTACASTFNDGAGRRQTARPEATSDLKNQLFRLELNHVEGMLMRIHPGKGMADVGRIRDGGRRGIRGWRTKGGSGDGGRRADQGMEDEGRICLRHPRLLRFERSILKNVLTSVILGSLRSGESLR
ncbi:unnamed protein product [Darwinula stevensoni]|uniref:Uncharacterized protein n=1 Tax=Darwinula stevensoni TaxID=69355 RepID=A0A7R9A9H4_9CRUS|nr:unnamed protein product [Darwinula stevensoni]CAG0897410.1 unnamed protein product [Darwinula stevensoni]